MYTVSYGNETTTITLIRGRTEKFQGRTRKRSLERSGERSLERSGERSLERSGERSLERSGERSLERSGRQFVPMFILHLNFVAFGVP